MVAPLGVPGGQYVPVILLCLEYIIILYYYYWQYGQYNAMTHAIEIGLWKEKGAKLKRAINKWDEIGKGKRGNIRFEMWSLVSVKHKNPFQILWKPKLWNVEVKDIL